MFSATSLFLFVVSAPPLLILPSGLTPVSKEHCDALVKEEVQKGNDVIRDSDFVDYFIGFEQARLPDLKAVEQLAKEAGELEAHYDTLGANRLRASILDLFKQTSRPTAGFRKLAAQMTHELVAGWLTEGDEAKARHAAYYSLAHFATHSMDLKRQSPRVRSFYEQEKKRLDDSARINVALSLDQPGTLFIDGDNLGPISNRWDGTLLKGDYRAWIKTSKGWSLPHHFSVRDKPLEESILTKGQWCIRLAPYPHLECGGEEVGVMKNLLASFSADRGTVVDFHRGEKLTERRYDRSGHVELFDVGYIVSGEKAPMPSLEPLRYSPFGIGQYVQGRNLVGSAFLVSLLGLGVWHGVAIDHYAQVRAQGRLQDYSETRFQQNLSGGLLYGVVATSILEAILADWLE